MSIKFQNHHQVSNKHRISTEADKIRVTTEGKLNISDELRCPKPSSITVKSCLAKGTTEFSNESQMGHFKSLSLCTAYWCCSVLLANC